MCFFSQLLRADTTESTPSRYKEWPQGRGPHPNFGRRLPVGASDVLGDLKGKGLQRSASIRHCGQRRINFHVCNNATLAAGEKRCLSSSADPDRRGRGRVEAVATPYKENTF